MYKWLISYAGSRRIYVVKLGMSFIGVKGEFFESHGALFGGVVVLVTESCRSLPNALRHGL